MSVDVPRRWTLLHPFLVTATPIVFLLAHNASQVRLAAALFPLLAGFVVAALILAVCCALFRDRLQAGLASSLLLIAAMAYGSLFRAVWALPLVQTPRELHLTLVPLTGCLLALALLWLRRTQRPLLGAARFVTLLSAISITLSLGQLASAGIGREDARAKRAAPLLTVDDPARPDVYHIILDGYARADVLSAMFGHDNSGFLGALRSRGFYVADQSAANYPLTFLSLASTLSMRYLDEEIASLVAEHGPRTQERRSIYRLIQDNEIARSFQAHGYRYVHFATQYGGTERAETADTVIALGTPLLESEFVTVVRRAFMPWLPTVTTHWHVRPASTVAELHQFMLGKLPEVPAISGPTYTLFHILLPHHPYVFDRDGRVRALPEGDLQRAMGTPAEYVEQLEYLNVRVIALIDALLEQSPHPPVIVLHSDHGTATTVPPRGAPDAHWRAFARERLPILNAFLVPDPVKARLYPTISPVNSFRLLRAELLKEDVPLLPDRSFLSWYEAPLQVSDVTSELTSPRPDTAP